MESEVDNFWYLFISGEANKKYSMMDDFKINVIFNGENSSIQLESFSYFSLTEVNDIVSYFKNYPFILKYDDIKIYLISVDNKTHEIFKEDTYIEAVKGTFKFKNIKEVSVKTISLLL